MAVLQRESLLPEKTTAAQLQFDKDLVKELKDYWENVLWTDGIKIISVAFSSIRRLSNLWNIVVGVSWFCPVLLEVHPLSLGHIYEINEPDL